MARLHLARPLPNGATGHWQSALSVCELAIIMNLVGGLGRSGQWNCAAWPGHLAWQTKYTNIFESVASARHGLGLGPEPPAVLGLAS